MKRLSTYLALAGLVLATCALPSLAGAHDMPRERKILMQVHGDYLEVMVVYKEPAGRTVDLLLRRYDLDGDGKLIDGEAKLAGRTWTHRVLYGLEFEVEGERPRSREPEIKFRKEKSGALTAAVYARWDLDELTGDESRTVIVRVEEVEDNIPTALSTKTGESLTIRDITAPGAKRSPAGTLLLEPGQSAEITVTPDSE